MMEQHRYEVTWTVTVVASSPVEAAHVAGRAWPSARWFQVRDEKAPEFLVDGRPSVTLVESPLV